MSRPDVTTDDVQALASAASVMLRMLDAQGEEGAEYVTACLERGLDWVCYELATRAIDLDLMSLGVDVERFRADSVESYLSRVEGAFEQIKIEARKADE